MEYLKIVEISELCYYFQKTTIKNKFFLGCGHRPPYEISRLREGRFFIKKPEELRQRKDYGIKFEFLKKQLFCSDNFEELVLE